MSAPRRDAGFTLAELSVAMLVGGLLMAFLGLFVTRALGSAQTIRGHAAAGADARTALASLQHDLRVATSPGAGASPFVLADDDAMTFYTSAGATTATASPALTEVWYWVDASATTPCLRRAAASTTVSGGVASGPATRPTGGCLARGAVNAGGDALFTYYPAATSDDTDPDALVTGTGGLSSTDLLVAATVGIDLEVTPTTGNSSPSVLTSSITLINVVNDEWNEDAL